MNDSNEPFFYWSHIGTNVITIIATTITAIYLALFAENAYENDALWCAAATLINIAPPIVVIICLSKFKDNTALLYRSIFMTSSVGTPLILHLTTLSLFFMASDMPVSDRQAGYAMILPLSSFLGNVVIFLSNLPFDRFAIHGSRPHVDPS